MEKFQVLPTDERFQALSDEQIGFILESMVLDNKEQYRARKGLDSKNHFEDDDETFWNVPMEDFVALKDYHNEEDIVKQVEELVGKESMRKAKERFKSTEEYNEFLEKGGKLARQMEVDSYIEDKLKAVFNEAQELEGMKAKGIDISSQKKDISLKPVEVDTLNEAIALFNGTEDVVDNEDDFYI